jgi:hypothetical protein
MKIVYLLTVCMICVVSIFGCVPKQIIVRSGEASIVGPKEKSIIGVWAGKDEKGVDGAFVFNADGSADVLKRGVSTNGEPLKNRGTLTYHYDPSATPAAIDIVLTKRTGERTAIRAIVMFLSEDSIKLRISTSGIRPLDFSGAPGETIVLNRKTKP